MRPGSILFTCYGGGHAAALAPVIARLRDAGERVDLLAFTTAREYFRKRGIPTLGVADVLSLVPDYADARSVGRSLADGQGRHALVSIADTEAYLGIGYLALERAFGRAEAEARYAALGRQAFRPRDFFERLFTVVRPAAVVATNSPRSERAALDAARTLRIPSLCLVDLYAPFEIEWCGAPGYATTICVLNDAVRTRFVEHGADPDAVVVTGNPAFDRLGLIDYQQRRRCVRERAGLRSADRVLLWISQPEPAIHPFSGAVGDPTLPERIERYLADSFADDRDVRIIMRLHPSEDRPPAVAGARIRYSDASEPLDDLLCLADCVVTCSSTVGLEAAMLGVPVVQLMDSVFSPDLPLGALGVAIEVPHYYEAATVIDRCLRDVPALSGGGGTDKPDFQAAAKVAARIRALVKDDG
ncbi:MAG: UDP-N-acetylglucosamine 2-epimerase [Pseudomonadota bacterium]